MNAFELFLLGRTLMKIAEESMQRAGYRHVPASVRTIVMDVALHPDSAIGEIVTRTGFPQSHVSASVATLRERGTFVTGVDREDRRRTLVRLSPEFRRRAAEYEPAPIDESLSEALSPEDAANLDSILGSLEELSDRLSPKVLERLRARLESEPEAELV